MITFWTEECEFLNLARLNDPSTVKSFIKLNYWHRDSIVRKNVCMDMHRAKESTRCVPNALFYISKIIKIHLDGCYLHLIRICDACFECAGCVTIHSTRCDDWYNAVRICFYYYFFLSRFLFALLHHHQHRHRCWFISLFLCVFCCCCIFISHLYKSIIQFSLRSQMREKRNTCQLYCAGACMSLYIFSSSLVGMPLSLKIISTLMKKKAF